MPRRIRRSTSASGLIRQPGSKLSYKQDGSLEGLLLLEGDAAFRNARPQINDRHPDDPRAVCYNCDVENLKNGKIRVTAAFIGVTNDPTPWFREGQASLDKESIVTHPDFISKIGGTASSPKNKALFDPETKEFIGFETDAPNDLGGVDSWFVPSVLYRFTRWTYQQPEFNDLGKIDTPPIAIRRPSNVKNFLAWSATYREIGQLFQVTLELAGSGPKGWNPIIYSR